MKDENKSTLSFIIHPGHCGAALTQVFGAQSS